MSKRDEANEGSSMEPARAKPGHVSLKRAPSNFDAAVSRVISEKHSSDQNLSIPKRVVKKNRDGSNLSLLMDSSVEGSSKANYKTEISKQKLDETITNKEQKYSTAVKPILEENAIGDGDESSALE